MPEVMGVMSFAGGSEDSSESLLAFLFRESLGLLVVLRFVDPPCAVETVPDRVEAWRSKGCAASLDVGVETFWGLFWSALEYQYLMANLGGIGFETTKSTSDAGKAVCNRKEPQGRVSA